MYEYFSRATRRRSGAHGTNAKALRQQLIKERNLSRERYYQTWGTVASPALRMILTVEGFIKRGPVSWLRYETLYGEDHAKRAKNRLPCRACTNTSQGRRDIARVRTAPMLRLSLDRFSKSDDCLALLRHYQTRGTVASPVLTVQLSMEPAVKNGQGSWLRYSRLHGELHGKRTKNRLPCRECTTTSQERRDIAPVRTAPTLRQ